MGRSKHLKRLNAPKHWMLHKMGGVWAPRPSSGPHKLRECMPLVILLRNRLKYATTYREAKLILNDRQVLVDGRVRTDPTYPAGFMDVVQFRRSGEYFRLIYDVKGRFVPLTIGEEEANTKLCKVLRTGLGKRAIPYCITTDGRTLRYIPETVKAGDTIKIDIAENKYLTHIPYALGNVCMVTLGKSIGRVGTIAKIETHPGSYTAVHITDKRGDTFITRAENVFVIGEGEQPWIGLPRDQGIRPDIFEARERRLAARLPPKNEMQSVSPVAE